MDIVAAVVETAGADFVLQPVSLDAPRPDEVLVRIVGVGLCHTDVVAQSGLYSFAHPFVLGHEGAGVVEAVGGEVHDFAPGDRVTISFRSCGTCVNCQAGLPPYCLTWGLLNVAGMRPDGSTPLHRAGEPLSASFFGQSSFASHVISYPRNLVKVPDGFPLELAGPLGCGIQTGAGAVLRSLSCQQGSSIVIAGGGPVGLSAVMAAKIAGCSPIILIEPHADRRALGTEFGATHVIDPIATADVTAAILAIVPAGANHAIDTTGRADTLTALLLALTSHGQLGLIGIAPSGTPLPGEVNLVMGRGIRIIGIIEGDSDPAVFIPELIAHHAAGRLPYDRMIKTYKLSQIMTAIAEQASGICIKAVLIPD